MKRTQLYLDEDLWGELHARAQRQRTTVSQLVRAAARERYLGDHGQRMKAMEAFIGIRKTVPGELDAVETVRSLRRDDRLDRLMGK